MLEASGSGWGLFRFRAPRAGGLEAGLAGEAGQDRRLQPAGACSADPETALGSGWVRLRRTDGGRCYGLSCLRVPASGAAPAAGRQRVVPAVPDTEGKTGRNDAWQGADSERIAGG